MSIKAQVGGSPRAHPSRVRLLVGLALALACTLALAGQATAGCGVDPDILDELLDRASQEGSVNILVTLAVEWTPEGYLPDQEAVDDQRAAIAAAQDSLEQELGESNATIYARFKYIPGMAVNVDEDALTALAKSELVCFISEDSEGEFTLNDTTVQIGANLAWDQGYSGGGWLVAVIDTGVDKYHPFLSGKVNPAHEACYSYNGVPGPDCESLCPGGSNWMTGDGTSLPSPYTGQPFTEVHAHGTHVAGVAVGRHDSYPLFGVARDAGLIPIKVAKYCAHCGGGLANPPCITTSESDVLAALIRVHELWLEGTRNIAAVNLSISFGTQYASVYDCDQENSLLRYSIRNLLSRDIAVIAASGNQANSGPYGLPAPACLSEVVSVGNVTKQDEVYLSVQGCPDPPYLPDCWCPGGGASLTASFLDLLAPGSASQYDCCGLWCLQTPDVGGVLSSIPPGFPEYDPYPDGYARRGGTSTASPHVAGAFAILRQAYPNDSVEDILTRLIMTGVPIEDPRNALITPRIQVDAALGFTDVYDDVWVDFGYYEDGQNQWGLYFLPFDSLAEGLGTVPTGGKIRITSRHGTNCRVEPIVITSQVTLQAVGGPVLICGNQSCGCGSGLTPCCSTRPLTQGSDTSPGAHAPGLLPLEAQVLARFEP